MSETTQMQPITISAQEYAEVMQFTAQMPSGVVEDLRMFFKRKQAEAQQIEQARARAEATKGEKKPVAAATKKK